MHASVYNTYRPTHVEEKSVQSISSGHSYCQSDGSADQEPGGGEEEGSLKVCEGLGRSSNLLTSKLMLPNCRYPGDVMNASLSGAPEGNVQDK